MEMSNMMERQKRINISPTGEGLKKIEKAVEILKKEGKKVSITSFCHDSAIEIAEKIIKERVLL